MVKKIKFFSRFYNEQYKVLAVTKKKITLIRSK